MSTDKGVGLLVDNKFANFFSAGAGVNFHNMEYFKNNMGYDIPPMTPFVGKNFNVTRAGIHADGLLKDEEIYNIFNTKKLLNRAVGVMITKTSGLAGIAYWINEKFGLKGEQAVTKQHPMVLSLKGWIDAEYEDGRQTALTDDEILEQIEKIKAL